MSAKLCVVALCVAILPGLGACGAPPRMPAERPPSPPLAAELPAASGADSEFVEAAERIVGFLRGEVAFDRIRIADAVTLRLAPEGGGAQTVVPDESLRDPENWAVRTASGARVSMVPPRASMQLTMKPGVHFNCLEYPLESPAPELAGLPHVGTMLAPDDATSCLQTWNLTLVFDPRERPPLLTAAVYDQWEW